MRRKDVHIGMLLHAWTSLWGEFIFKVTEITPSSPARVRGTILKTLKQGYGFRAGKLGVGRTIEVGIISVRTPTPEELNL